MQTYYTPLRYPGGKSSLLRYLSQIVEYNAPIETYIEPYAGGAGAAIGLLLNNRVQNIILNDADELVYHFWYSLLNEKTELINKIKETPVNIDQYRIQKSILFDTLERQKASSLMIGFSTFYVNRCNRSGILRSGPIGGYNQTGSWKIDARFNKPALIERIEKIYNHRKKIKIFNMDAIVFLKTILPSLDINSLNSLVYLDPPYYMHGPELYRKYYKKQQHDELRDFLLNKTDFKWILSYDDVPYINEIYTGYRINGKPMNHFAYKAKLGKELIIVSDDCLLKDSHEK